MIGKLFVGCCLYLGLSIALHGQGSEPVSIGFSHKFNGDLDDGSQLAVNRWSLNAGVPVYRENGSFIALSASLAYDQYDFSGDFDPWSEVHKHSIGVPVIWKLNEKWTWASVFRVGASWEQGADIGESLTYGGVSSINYKFSDTLTLGPGIHYFSELEDDASLFPILSIRWQITDDLYLGTGPSDGAGSGANVFLKYNLNQNWDLLTGLYYQSERLRLDEASQVAPSGVGEETSFALYGVVKYFPQETFSFSVIGGLTFANEYGLFDESGNELEIQEGDMTPFIGIRMNYEF